jgi:hypothetical protein
MAKQGKEVVGLEAVKDKRDRLILQNELTEMADLKTQMESITNYAKTGTLDKLKESVLERMQKCRLGDVWLKVGNFKHALQPGANVTYPKDKIQKAMMHYGVDPDIQSAILMEAEQRTTYVSVVTKAVGEAD